MGKLVKEEGIVEANKPWKVDYSCDQIVYHFRSNGTLSISSDRQHFRPREGSFSFVHQNDNVYALTTRQGQPWAGRIQDKGSKMTLSGMHFDAGVLFFVRIK